MDSKSNKELEKLLITCDYLGKEVKKKALQELLNRAYQNGQNSEKKPCLESENLPPLT